MPAMKVVYTRLIDITPSDLSAMLTAMVEAHGQTKETGQVYTILIADLQLYCVMVSAIWIHPELLSNVINMSMSLIQS